MHMSCDTKAASQYQHCSMTSWTRYASCVSKLICIKPDAGLHVEAAADLTDVLLLGPELGRVVVVDDLEGLAAVRKVARVDADLLEGLRHHHGHRGLEVDVRHQGHVIAAQKQQHR